MLNIPDGFEIKCEYNCFDDKDVQKVLESVKEIYLTRKKIIEERVGTPCYDWEDYTLISDIMKLLNIRVFHCSERNNWRGSAFIIFLYNHNFYLYQTCYGSCSFCDIWQANDFVANLYEQAQDIIKFPTYSDLLKYILCKEWSCCDEDAKELKIFAKKEALKLADEPFKPKYEQYEELKMLLEILEKDKN